MTSRCAAIALLGCWALAFCAKEALAAAPANEAEQALRARLDAPLLFVKRHSYTGIHIYDTYYKWPPGGGGIYVLENPAAPPSAWKIRPVIDPTTPGTLGTGVYTHPELSYDGRKLLFCFKAEPNGNTSVYEIGIDGRGLRRLTDPSLACDCYKGSHGGQHDIAPAYLPDGRIVLLSTRPSGLVPCANEGVSILHVMNADGTDLHPISVNNVNEFDPSILPDGRILFGRWEYVDKNALTIQSLWTINPDGTNETALFANNMVFPEAILDARAVPGSHLIVGTLAKHNSTPRGTIGFIDPRLGKNNPAAILNLEHPDDPTFDRGDSCEPWPLDDNVVLYSGRPTGSKRNVLMMTDRQGYRFTLMADPEICLHSPMLVKPRPAPAVIAPVIDRRAKTGRFFVQDIYQGLPDVKRGEVKWLRVIEETSRVSATPGGKQPYNQTFLVSAALAFSVKNFLGVVPVEADGSAYFEVPSGRAVYLQALDGDGRLVQSMRTFVQAAPGATRSCIGCHEYKYSASMPARANLGLLDRAPAQLQPESWGSGYVDYPSMVQPVLNRNCVSCHGGEQGFGGRIDLTGGWTEHFNISYENLVNRRETQLVAYWIAGIDCMNGTAHYSSQLFAPRSHGSGAAPLARLLVEGHGGRLPDLSRRDRDLLLAWIDSNGLYHGSWDYSQHGCAIQAWQEVQKNVRTAMDQARCTTCHSVVESDWINLERPELSRVLRAPLAKGGGGFGEALCRQRKVEAAEQRLRLLWKGYAHAVQTLDKFERRTVKPRQDDSPAVVSFASTRDPHYQALRAAIEQGRESALAAPRVDMPGAEIMAGACRQFVPPPLPAVAPALNAAPGDDGAVELRWEQSARTIGLESEIYRGDRPNFALAEATRLVRTTRFGHSDTATTAGRQHYALVLVSGDDRSAPAYASIDVPAPAAPPAPVALQAESRSYAVRLAWRSADGRPRSYHVYRAKPGGQPQRLTDQPVRETSYVIACPPNVPFTYSVRSVSRRGLESAPNVSEPVAAIIVREPVFAAAFQRDATGLLDNREKLPGKIAGKAIAREGTLELGPGGQVSYPHRSQFDLGQPITVECWVRLDERGKMPVVISCGLWRNAGWFLQAIGGRWRWHVGGIDCDGGKIELGRWIHLAASYDGQTAQLYQDGKLVGRAAGTAIVRPWPGDLVVGQYGGIVSADFQTIGRMAGVKIYHRPLDPAEIMAAAEQPPGR